MISRSLMLLSWQYSPVSTVIVEGPAEEMTLISVVLILKSEAIAEIKKKILSFVKKYVVQKIPEGKPQQPAKERLMKTVVLQGV